MPATVAAMASSHAYTFADPQQWEDWRKRTRSRYAARYGSVPPEVPQIEGETLEANQRRFTRITGGLAKLKDAFETFRPDAIVVVGDDQDEQFHENIPQFAIYTGERFVAFDRGAKEPNRSEYPNNTALAAHLFKHSVEAGIDVSEVRAFANGELISHAHTQILTLLRPNVPVIPVFVNAIHVPAPSPQRCYVFGEALAAGLAALPAELRVVVYASGGLSHFSAGFPYPHYKGPYQIGSIAEKFDHDLVDLMRRGEGAKLASLTSSALVENGGVEMRQWITMLGLLGDRKPEWLVYEPFYRAIMGMGVGYWPPVLP